MAPWTVFTPTMISAAFIFLAATVGMAWLIVTIAPDRTETASDRVGRHMLSASSTPSNVVILDTATSQIRACLTDEATLSPTCGDWSQN